MPDREPSGVNDEVIATFRTMGGTVGRYFADLCSCSRPQGKERTTAHGPAHLAVDDGRYLVAAAAGGAPRHPAWYHNLLADPTVTVEVGTERFEATAFVANGRERDMLHDRFVTGQPQLAHYQSGTNRQIPMVTLALSKPGTSPP